MRKRRPDKPRRGRPPVPIERDPQKFEMALWDAFVVGKRCGPFDAARRALLVVKGGEITMADIEGVLRRASAEIPLPPLDPDEPDKGLRRFSAKAKRAQAQLSPWLLDSSLLIQALFEFIPTDNLTGMVLMLDGLERLGWGPVIIDLAERIDAALGSNLPPADLEKLSPAVRRLLAKLKK